MQQPPFKLALSPIGSAAGWRSAATPDCCGDSDSGEPAVALARTRLAQLDPHLHCSVIGTCLGTAELRKLVARFVDVKQASDLEVHHEAVRLATQGGSAAKVLHKALDQHHDAALQRFARVHAAAELGRLWEEALHQGEIPGAYWAVLTHRDATAGLRQRAFGDVHMLSHLVGASNRADIRKLTALQAENAELRERLERQQVRAQETLNERDAVVAGLQQALAEARAVALAPRQEVAADSAVERRLDDPTADLIAVQTERRERAEQAATGALAEATRLGEELEHLRQHVDTLGRELAAAETELREGSGDAAAAAPALDASLRGRRILYVGGRPSSTPAIRDLVARHGGEFQRHDGGLEDRKGLLASAVARAQLVVFPVDCVDHDSAGNLKRLCARHGIPFVALRSASVASFAAALLAPAPGGEGTVRPACVKNG